MYCCYSGESWKKRKKLLPILIMAFFCSTSNSPGSTGFHPERFPHAMPVAMPLRNVKNCCSSFLTSRCWWKLVLQVSCHSVVRGDLKPDSVHSPKALFEVRHVYTGSSFVRSCACLLLLYLLIHLVACASTLFFLSVCLLACSFVFVSRHMPLVHISTWDVSSTKNK